MADSTSNRMAVGESEAASARPYDEQLSGWARAIIADQTPVKGGFAPAPVFPIPPIGKEGCDE